MAPRPRKPVVERLSDLSAPGMVKAADVARLTDLIGLPGFVRGLLEVAQPYFRPTFVSVMCIGDDATPFLVGTECTVGRSRAALAAKGYARHFAEDTNFRLMQPGGEPGDFSTYQTRGDVAAMGYRRDCYDRPGIADRRSVVRKRPGYALALNFYRGREVGEFDERDRGVLDGLLPMLLSATERHVAFGLKGKLANAGDTEATLAIACPGLTARERQVLALALRGKTAAQIAGDLGIAETTVITHRKRAYKRIGVKNLRELMRQ